MIKYSVAKERYRPEIWHFVGSPVGSTFTLNGELLTGIPP